MGPIRNRRYDKIYEQILLSRPFAVVVGWFFTVAIPAAVYWGLDVFGHPDNGQLWGLTSTTFALLISYVGVFRLLTTYPGGQSMGIIVPQVILVYGLCALVPLVLRIDISRYLILTSGAAAIAWFQIEYLLTERYRRPKLAIVDLGMAGELLQIPRINARKLHGPDLGGIRYDAVVADFDCLTPEWERFLTRCALDRIAVYNARSVYESVTGRVRIHRMSENDIGSLLPSPFYERTKAALDWLMIVLSMPITVPLVCLVGLLVKIESPGPVFYTQERVGLGNRRFKIYKIRSMRFDQNSPPQFAGEDDPRITRTGRVIRRYRIDELPQFINVLRGEMSLIGPRPEQPDFVAHFDRELPFYTYRHVVKPGISGWAQVRHGYAANLDETREKIEHDFYYIKHCSLFLDFYILILTIKTLYTGSGAR
ncbi:sugar transferase [Parapusillimonas sp. SGNA-6]|nr:sugar transferase [Parapusillimonas sp. SGNA-6]